MPEGQREPWIELDSRSKQATGSGGCNRMSGGYEAGDGTLHFDRLISTQMACPALEIETAFFRALERTRHYRVSGRTLELMDAAGNVLARLEEGNLR
jgi:putative lipoprotein